MKPVHCPHFDALTHNLVDAYARLGDSDVLCALGGTETSGEIDRVHLQMAEHRRTCPVCSKIDHERQQTRTPSSMH
jgi:hypothetical protein